MKHTLTRFTIALAIATTGAFTAWLVACGPFLTGYVTVRAVHPATVAAFASGTLGIVRPPLARRYLVHAYRSWSAKPVLRNGLVTAADVMPDGAARQAWIKDAAQVTGRPAPLEIDPMRQTGKDYQWFQNCPDHAFAAASRTLAERTAKYRAGSATVREWVAAQEAVFTNCSNNPLALPAPPAAGSDALTRADRAYQTAASYFYAMQYEEAAKRFRAIAADVSSPWQPYGRYLAARATIRRATVPEDPGPKRNALLADAAKDLQAVVVDPGASALGASARGLLDFIGAQIDPVAQLHALARDLAGAPQVRDQQVIDYQILFDRIVGDTVEFAYDGVEDRAAMVDGDDLTDWILAMQGSGDGAATRALARWKATSSVPWMVAALWKVPATDAAAASLLDAAAKVPRTSPAFPTVAFLRTRLLVNRGNRNEARALLETLPSSPDGQFHDEAINLLKSQRLRLAASMDELLANVSRTIVAGYDGGSFDAAVPAAPPIGDATVDVDGAIALSYRLPLDRMVEAANAPTLPATVGRRIAVAAFTRAVLLGRHDAAIQVAPRLRALTPALAPDLDRFTSAPSGDERHLAAIRLLLRTPGMRPTVRAGDDSQSLESEPQSPTRIAGAPAAMPIQREFDHVFRRNWWCEFDAADSVAEVTDWGGASQLLVLAYPRAADGDPEERRRRAAAVVPAPSFLTSAERATLDRESAAIAELGIAPDYLAAEAIKWATAHPKDLDAAEALAHAVEGARWSCVQGHRNAALTRRAFEVLHRTFPQSEWAKKTKYWY